MSRQKDYSLRPSIRDLLAQAPTADAAHLVLMKCLKDCSPSAKTKKAWVRVTEQRIAELRVQRIEMRPQAAERRSAGGIILA